jgi:hypothetical protein
LEPDIPTLINRFRLHMVRHTSAAVETFDGGRTTISVRPPVAPRSATLAAYVAACTLVLLAPFELTTPLVRVRWQSITNLETVIVAAFALWLAASAWSRQWPRWRTPLTPAWMALLAAMGAAAAFAPAARANALHMTGRLMVAFALYLMVLNGVTTTARLRRVMGATVIAGLVVSVLAILEFFQIAIVLEWLTAFRPGVSVVGSQIRAAGPLQYPTIASMYLEIAFAFGIGLLIGSVDTRQRRTTVALFVALLVIAEGIVLTLTRAGLATMVTSMAGAVLWRGRLHGVDGSVRLIAALATLIAVLFVASRSTQSLWLRLTSEGQEVWYRSSVQAPPAIAFSADESRDVPVTVTNTGRLTWDSEGDPPFYLSYHWLELDRDRFVAFEGARTAFDRPVSPGATATVQASVRPPAQPGRYRLMWDVVHEGRLWFSTEPGATPVFSQASVVGPAVAHGIQPSARPPLPQPRERPGRLQLWRAAARIFAAYPLLGVGPDNFRLLYGDFAGLTNPDPRMHSNNMYIEILVGSGLVGALAFGWLLCSTARRLAARVREAASDRSLVADVGVALAVVAIGLHGAVDSFLAFTPTYTLFGLTLGLAMRSGSHPETS